MASVSRAAAQAAAAQVPNDDPYRTPSASPANMRMLAGEKHGAAVNMGPPPPYKSCKPTQRTQQHNQAAVTPVGAHGLLDYPKLPAPGTAAGWQMPTSLGQPMQAAAAGACSTPQAAAAGACSTPSPSGARYVSPMTGPGPHMSAPQQRQTRASCAQLQLEERMQEMDDSAERLQAAGRVLGNMEQRAIAAETAVEPLMQRVAVLERSGRAEAAARIAYLEQQLQQSEANEAQFGEQLSRARERARQVEGQAQVSQARLAKCTTAQEQLRECKQEADEARADLEEMEEQDDWKGRFSELQVQLKSGQTWQLTRPKGSGRGARMLQWGHRVAIWQQHANGTPPSAIGANICTVAKATAPWLNPVEPTVSTIRQERFALGIAEEAMAARRVAEAHTVKQMGFDETTKFQDPSMTTAMVVQPTEGAPLQVVILRAAYAIGGATSEACAEGIEAKCFQHLRQHLRGWEDTFHRMFPSLEWTGPDVVRCGLQRLGGGGAVMSDTCSQARKTKRLLILMVAKQIEEKHPNWIELSEGEQEAAVRVHTHDCWQHIRNIFLGPMSKAQSAHTKEQLAEKLAFFGAHERMTTDFDNLLRADYKEFHPGGRYAKGHGKEYGVWLKVHPHPRLVSHHTRSRALRHIHTRRSYCV